MEQKWDKLTKIAICDSNREDREKIYEFVKKYMNYTGKGYNIAIFLQAQELLDCRENFDLIILDVDINGMDGISVGTVLYKHYPAKIIYITNHPEYCRQAINQVHAFAYLEKPYFEKDLIAQLKVLINTLEIQSIPEKLYFEVVNIVDNRIRKCIMKFEADKIYYFEYINRRVKIKLEKKEYFYMGKMVDIVLQMEKYGFVRCHNAFIVNMNHICCINGHEITLDNKECIPISERKAADFRKKEKHYIHN